MYPISRHRYVPAWWLPGPHVRTLWPRFVRRRSAPALTAIRYETPDGDFLDTWRIDAPTGAPRLLLLHGLEGGIRSHYARGMLGEAHRRGWGADLLIFRSCGTELNRVPRFYHSGETTDLAFVLDRLVAEFPDSRVFLAGVSLGGNVLLKFLGERGAAVPAAVGGALAVSVPYDLARSSRHINRGFSRVYQAYFLRSLLTKAAAKARAFPSHVPGVRASTLYDFDDAITAPLHGFRDADDYYARSSAIRWIGSIRIPTLLLSAEDDPFLPRDVLDAVRRIASTNPSLEVEFVRRGGHVGFVSGRLPWRSTYYAEHRMGEYFAELMRSWRPAGAGRSP